MINIEGVNGKVFITEIESDIQNRIIRMFDVEPTVFSKYDLKEKYEYVLRLLKEIVNQGTTISYLFIILETKLQEKYSKDLVEPCLMILANNELYEGSIEKDVCFAAFYLVALYYYRQKDINNLAEIIKKYYLTYIDDYPLTYEILERFAVVKGDAVSELKLASVTLNQIKSYISKKGVVKAKTSEYVDLGNNVAINVGFTNSVVFILDYLLVRNDIELEDKEGVAKLDLHDFKNEIPDLFDRSEINTIKSSLLSIKDLPYTIDLISDALSYNPNYPKYHYLLAKMIFYNEIITNKSLSLEKRNEIYRFIDNALELNLESNKDYELNKTIYESFRSTVDDYFVHIDEYLNSNNSTVRIKDEIIRSKNNKECEPHIKNKNAHHLFISYSSMDYKKVYCDLVEMDSRGISYDYDEDLISTREKDKQEWYKIVEDKVKNSDCVICYLSENYIKSEACIKELEFVLKHKKDVIAIDTTGLCTISKIIAKVIKDGHVFASKELSILTKIFSDEKSVIVRQKAIDSNSHFVKLSTILLNSYPKVISFIKSDSIQSKNKVDHPLEDYLIQDDKNKIYMVLDGITRPKYDDKNVSPAFELTKNFGDYLHDIIVKKMMNSKSIYDVSIILKDCFKEANSYIKKLYKYDSKFIEEPIGCVGVVAIIFQNTLIYGGFGDSEIFIDRQNQMSNLFSSQTDYAFKVLKIEKDRELLYKEYVNIPGKDHGYGVVNGAEGVNYYFNPSFIELNVNDVIYLCSDGLSNYIRYKNPKILRTLSMKAIIKESLEFDKLIKNKKIDDKTLIKISVGV